MSSRVKQRKHRLDGQDYVTDIQEVSLNNDLHDKGISREFRLGNVCVVVRIYRTK